MIFYTLIANFQIMFLVAVVLVMSIYGDAVTEIVALNHSFELIIQQAASKAVGSTIAEEVEALVAQVTGGAVIPLAGSEWLAIVLTPEQSDLVRASKHQLVEWEKKLSPWKLHISADPVNAGAIIRAINNVLLDKKPYCKVLPNEAKLSEFNNFFNKEIPYLGHYKTGRLLTIYGRSDKEILELAEALDKSLSQAITEKRISQPEKGTTNHTDRPIGETGHLWARHAQAGAPLMQVAYDDHDTATAQEGRYNLSFVNESGLAEDEGISILQEDIFEPRW